MTKKFKRMLGSNFYSWQIKQVELSYGNAIAF